MNHFARSGRVPIAHAGQSGPRFPRRVLAAATTAITAAALSGCMMWSPVQTDVPYEPSDGVPVDLGAVQVRSLLVITTAKGAEGTLSGAAINLGDTQTEVSFSSAGAKSGSVTVAPGLTAPLTSVTIPAVSAAPGGLVDVEVSTPATGVVTVKVPVLPPALYYATVTPSATATP